MIKQTDIKANNEYSKYRHSLYVTYFNHVE